MPQTSDNQRRVHVPSLGNVHYGSIPVGPNLDGQYELDVLYPVNLSTDTPTTVLLQPRQSANQDFGFTDQFDVMVITTTRNQLHLRVRRADVAGGGWGQDLQLDFVIVE